VRAYLGEDGGVIVESKREMVLDEVLPRHAQVEGVPELELLPHLLQTARCGHVRGEGDRSVEQDLRAGQLASTFKCLLGPQALSCSCQGGIHDSSGNLNRQWIRVVNPRPKVGTSSEAHRKAKAIVRSSIESYIQ
jgi:hypothetical protein